MEESKQLYEREVKSFGDGGAHITLPSDLIGQTVEITPKTWDSELGGEIHTVNGHPTTTLIDTEYGSEAYASPMVRDKMRTENDSIAIGITSPSDTTTSQVYSYPVSVFNSHVIIHGDTGMGRTELMRNMVWQYVSSTNTNNGCVFIGAEGFGIGKIRQLFRNNNVLFNYMSITSKDADVTLEIDASIPALVDISQSDYDNREEIINHVLHSLIQNNGADNIQNHAVFIDEYPIHSLTKQTMENWTDNGVNIITTMHNIEMVDDSDTIQWVLNNTEFMTFRTTSAHSWDTLSNMFNTHSEILANLNRYEVLLCSQNNEHIQVFPPVPHFNYK